MLKDLHAVEKAIVVEFVGKVLNRYNEAIEDGFESDCIEPILEEFGSKEGLREDLFLAACQFVDELLEKDLARFELGEKVKEYAVYEMIEGAQEDIHEAVTWAIGQLKEIDKIEVTEEDKEYFMNSDTFLNALIEVYDNEIMSM